MSGNKRDETTKAAHLGIWIILLITLTPALRAAETKANTPAQATSQHGYALLFDLLGDEQNVSKLLIVKRDRPELKKLVKAISESAGKAHKELEKFGKHGEINLKDQGLPDAEVQTRKSISQEKAKTLLAEKGSDFEIALLLTQDEALTYGSHLARVLAASETHADRLRLLLGISSNLAELRNQVMEMLREHLKG
jgi:hypothetical protein